jgi:CrcB protein
MQQRKKILNEEDFRKEHLLLILFGGSLGVIVHYLLFHIAHNILGRYYPHSTLFINLVNAAFVTVLAFLLLICIKHDLKLDVLIISGILGCFAVLYTFSIQTVGLITRKRLLAIPVKVLLNVFSTIGAMLVGAIIMQNI